MARGTTLGQMVNDLRIEARLDPNPALSQNLVPAMKLALKREQERLYDDFDWPFLSIHEDKPTSAGERYYDIPDQMNFERITKVDFYWGGKWFPLDRGIGTEQYNQYDSDQDVRSDPAYRWDVRETGDGAQIEIWPIPITSGNLMRFTGYRKLKPLLSDDDKADLDDQVLVMFSSAEFIKDKNLAGEKRQKAVTRLRRLEGRSIQNRSGGFVLGGPQPVETSRYPTPLVAYVRNQ